MKKMKILVHLVAILLLLLLGFVYAAYAKSNDNLLWVPGVLFFFGICFNWYLCSRLFSKLTKDKK